MITREEYEAYKAADEKVVMREDNGHALCWHCKKVITNDWNRWSFEKAVQHSGSTRRIYYYNLYFHHECMMEVAGDEYNIEEDKPDSFEPF